jgi:[acyl-carrier-protein] S-malonyltransferase
MRPAAEVLEKRFAEISFGFRAPSVPVIMNVDAKVEKDPDGIIRKLVRQAMEPVQWEKTLLAMQKMGVDTFIEIGPGKTLSGFVKKTCKDARILRVENNETLNETLEALRS